MDRREFLKRQARGALILSSGLAVTKIVSAAPDPDIAVVKGTPAAATRGAVELLGGIRKFVKPGNRVVIKPNMSFSVPPERASNTHPEVVRELVILCKEAGASKILVLDHTLASPDSCLDTSEIRPACDALGEKVVFAINRPEFYQEIDITGARDLHKTQIVKEALKADVLIAAPVAKSHSSTGVSLSMKGMMGLIWDRRIMHWQDLHTGIVDLCTQLKADLTVIDGSRVLSTNGPGGPGKVIRQDTIIASGDMVAADAYAVASFEWYGKRFKPRQVKHILEAHRRGLGRMDLENLNIHTLSL